MELAGRYVELDKRLSWLGRTAPALAVQAVDEALVGHSGRARLAFDRTSAVKFAYLDAAEPDGLPLRLYPADTLEQARVFYSSPARVQRTLGLRRRGWRVEPNFHFGYRERGLCWSRSGLTADDTSPTGSTDGGHSWVGWATAKCTRDGHERVLSCTWLERPPPW